MRTMPAGALDRLLTPTERDRLARMREQGDRDRFATARAAVRSRAAAWMGIDAERVEIRTVCSSCGSHDHGKPRVTSPAGAAPEVSLAHAAELVVVALTRAGDVGVDVEPSGAAVSAGLGDVFLSAAERQTPSGPAATAASRLRQWVRKEAVLKATGRGLATDPRDVVIGAHGNVIRVPDDNDPTSWLLRDVDLVDGYLCTVAVRVSGRGPVAVQVVGIDPSAVSG